MGKGKNRQIGGGEAAKGGEKHLKQYESQRLASSRALERFTTEMGTGQRPKVGSHGQFAAVIGGGAQRDRRAQQMPSSANN